MSTAGSIVAQISPRAAEVLAALQRLTRERVPHDCGGFNTDDMKWQMGQPFIDLDEAIDELTEAKLIRYSGFDEECARGTESCFVPLCTGHVKPRQRFDRRTDLI